jgi:hypothetical protein
MFNPFKKLITVMTTSHLRLELLTLTEKERTGRSMFLSKFETDWSSQQELDEAIDRAKKAFKDKAGHQVCKAYVGLVSMLCEARSNYEKSTDPPLSVRLKAVDYELD